MTETPRRTIELTDPRALRARRAPAQARADRPAPPRGPAHRDRRRRRPGRERRQLLLPPAPARRSTGSSRRRAEAAGASGRGGRRRSSRAGERGERRPRRRRRCSSWTSSSSTATSTRRGAGTSRRRPSRTQWQEAAFMRRPLLYVTAEELAAVGRELDAVTERYIERIARARSSRPSGSRPVEPDPARVPVRRAEGRDRCGVPRAVPLLLRENGALPHVLARPGGLAARRPDLADRAAARRRCSCSHADAAADGLPRRRPRSLPNLLFSLHAGAWVDRRGAPAADDDRRRRRPRRCCSRRSRSPTRSTRSRSAQLYVVAFLIGHARACSSSSRTARSSSSLVAARALRRGELAPERQPRALVRRAARASAACSSRCSPRPSALVVDAALVPRLGALRSAAIAPVEPPTERGRARARRRRRAAASGATPIVARLAARDGDDQLLQLRLLRAVHPLRDRARCTSRRGCSGSCSAPARSAA